MFIRNVDKFMLRTLRHFRRRCSDDLKSQFLGYSLMITKYVMIWDLWSYLCLVQMICDCRSLYCVYGVCVSWWMKHNAIKPHGVFEVVSGCILPGCSAFSGTVSGTRWLENWACLNVGVDAVEKGRHLASDGNPTDILLHFGLVSLPTKIFRLPRCAYVSY
jgi:hypothetical protein